MNLNKLKDQGLTHLLELKSGKYDKYTGWLSNMSTESEVNEILETAKKVRKNSKVLVVVGVGGSYLGARAVIEALSNKYKRDMEVIYLGNSLSPMDLHETLDYLKTKDFTVNVISKSGTTMEPAIAFSFIKELLFNKYSKQEALDRIIVTTDERNGELRKFAKENNVKSFVIPEDVGGRFSVLTPVGLLPIAIAGFDAGALLEGARTASKELLDDLSGDNPAIYYAAARNVLHSQGFDIEIFVTYEERLRYFAEWWKQLFGESEGKDGKGIYPSSATFSTDLHSLGQMIQDGKRNMFETHLYIANYEDDLVVNPSIEDEGAIGDLKGVKMSYINEQAKNGTVEAHHSGGVTSIGFEMEKLDEFRIGNYMYFFMLSCSISALLLGVNPFDQPGVEEYKQNIKKLLSK